MAKPPSSPGQCAQPSVWALCVGGTHIQKDSAGPRGQGGVCLVSIPAFMLSPLTPRECVDTCVAPLECAGSCWCAYLLGVVNARWLAGSRLLGLSLLLALSLESRSPSVLIGRSAETISGQAPEPSWYHSYLSAHWLVRKTLPGSNYIRSNKV